MIKIKAIIMAGGEGTRLRPLTCALPKPMVPILNKPIMEYIIKLLKRNGIEDIAVTMAYLPDTIMDYFDDGSKWGVHLEYFTEESPLGTGGSVKNAQNFLEDTFLVISGDALTDIDIKEAIAFHKEKKSKATLVLKKEPYPLEYGVVVTNQQGRIIRFLEKPSWGEVFSDTINTGIYILEPEVMEYYQRGIKFDFSKDLFPELLKENLPMYGYVSKNYWCDIGDIRTYTQAQFDVLQGVVNVGDIHREYREIQKGVWLGQNVSFEKPVKLIPPVMIEKNSHIEKNVILGPYAVVGKACKIGEGSSVKNSVIWENSHLGKYVQSRGSIVCNKVGIGDRVNLYQQSAVGTGVRIHSGATLSPAIKVWPHKVIEENTIVDQHLIWGNKATKTLFGHRDISGQLNIDITPEFSSQLGSALAATLRSGEKLILTSDLNKGSQLIKQALITGIISAGRGVIDIGTGPLPILRYAIGYFKAQGGVHISLDLKDTNKIHIEIMNEIGANINREQERNIENIFNRGDFERVKEEQMKRVLYQQEFSSAYITKGLSFIEGIEKLKKRNINIIIASPSESILFLATALLEIMGCKVMKIKTSSETKEHFSYIEQQMQGGSIDIGVFIHEKGDSLILFDQEGHRIEQEDYELLADLILLKKGGSPELVVAHTFPEVLEEMAKKYDSKVKRTKSAPSQVMNEMLAINKNEQLLSYVLHYDAIWATAILVDYLVSQDMSLGALSSEIPKYYYKKSYIPCNWQDKGRIIKEMISQNKREDLELFEGVKIKSDKGWAIILPDSEKPVFNLYIQGNTEEYAQELSGHFSEKIKELMNQESTPKKG